MFPDPYESKVYSTEAVFDYISVEGLMPSDPLGISRNNRDVH